MLTITDLKPNKCYKTYLNDMCKEESIRVFKIESVKISDEIFTQPSAYIQATKGILINPYGIKKITSLYIIEGDCIEEVTEETLDDILSKLSNFKTEVFSTL